MAKIPPELAAVGLRELADICYVQLGKYPSPTATRMQMYDLLRYKQPEGLENPIDRMRDKIIAFIEERKKELALPCHGRCYEHHDALVVACYLELREDTDVVGRLEEIEM